MMRYFNSIHRTIPVWVGIVTSIVGLLVLCGWHTNNSHLIQFSTSFAMMNYSTALCFVAAGIGIVSMVKGNRHLPFFLGLFIVAISYLTVAECLLKVDLGINDFFKHELIWGREMHQGHTHLTASILMGIFGTCMVVLSRYITMNISWKFLYFSFIILSLIILMVSFSTLFSYAVDLPEIYGWGSNSKIAIHSVLAIFLLAIALIAIIHQRALEDHISFGYYVPWFVFFGIEVLTLSFWQASSAYVEKNAMQQNLVAANGIKSIVREELESRTEALARMAKRWENRKGGSPHTEWLKDADNIIKDQPGYQAIEWLDPKLIVTWVAPLKGNESVLNLDVLKRGSANPSLLKAIKSGETTVSPMVALKTGHKGFLIYTPIGKGKSFKGVIVGVINAKKFFQEALHDAIDNYNVSIYFGSKLLFKLHSENELSHKESLITYVIKDQNWSISSWPLPVQAKKLHSWLPISILVIGFIAAILLSLITHLAQVARRHFLRAQEEIKTRQKTEKQLIVYSKKLKKQSVSDALTGTNNRRGLNAILKSEIDQLKTVEKNLSVVLLDVDHFKKINDTHGHVVGDKVLQRVSNILKKNIRSTDTVARYGGEEFCIILNNTNDTQAYEVAEKLRGIISQETFYDEKKKPFQLTCSFGVYQVPSGAKNINAVFKVVDTALYTAKNSGRNCVILV